MLAVAAAPVAGEVRGKAGRPAQHGPPAEVLEDFILDTLAYKSMRDREEEVASAHAKTFEWIFEPEPDGNLRHHFATWLETDKLGPIYWVNGKPGSGKSTLMRFLFDHPSTTVGLESWAGDLQFLRAGFFFWLSGSKEQRSQTGLLRYLLHQLLTANRAMMPQTFPDLWQKLQAMTTKERIKMSLEWTAPELMEAFRSFVGAATEFSKICLFVDGLDEFDGNHQELILFFKDLGEGIHAGKIKMCLSSRPWPVFERSFQSSVPNFKLQDLSYHDMYHYTADRLREDVRIRSNMEEDATLGHALVDESVRRADGVFLWVRLAVDRMLKDFQPLRGIANLQVTVRGLPIELDDLFEKFIFADQLPAEVSETAKIFQLITAREATASFINDESANSLTVWELALALDSEDDVVALSDTEVRQASDDEVRRRCNSTCLRIEERFMGLLGVFARRHSDNKRLLRGEDDEIPAKSSRATGDSKISYVHRSIRDWLLEGDGIRDRLTRKSPEGFDPHLRLLRAGVLTLKMPLERAWRRRWLMDFWPAITLCMTHARDVQDDVYHLQGFVDELARTIGWYWVPSIGDGPNGWAKHLFGSYEVRMSAPAIVEPFLCLATKFSIAKYVQKVLEARIQEDSQSTPDARGT